MKNSDQGNNLNQKVAWKVFSEAEPGVTLHCSDEPHRVEHLKNLPKDLRPLAELVANPQTQESVWMNACVAAGDNSLVARQSLLGRAKDFSETLTGASFALLVLMLNVMTATLLSSYIAFLVNGVDPNVFMRGLIDSHGTGVTVAIGSGFAFWYSLLVQNGHLRRFFVVASITATALLVLLTGVNYLGNELAVLVGALAATFTGLLSTIAGYCREALPKSFSAANLAKSGVGILFIPATLNGLMVLAVISGKYQSSEGFSTPTIESTIFAAGILFFTICGQSLALSLASRTSSKAACALLSTCVQAPLLLGLSFTAMASLIKSFLAGLPNYNGIDYFAVMTNPANNWFQYGPDKAVFTLIALVLALSFALIGSYVGASINALRLKR